MAVRPCGDWVDRMAAVARSLSETLAEAMPDDASPPGVLVRVAVRKSVPGILWYDRWSRLLVQAPEEAMARMRVHYPPFYNAPVMLTRIRQILPTMGLRGELKVVLVASGTTDGTGEANLVRREQIWRRSQSVARLAEFIALWTRSEVVSGEVFQAGLLHDCALAMMVRGSEAHHAEAGEMMARIWGVPAAVGQAIRYHHDAGIELLDTLEEPRIWLILRLALCMYGVLAGEEMPPGDPGHPSGRDQAGRTVDVLAALGLRRYELRDLMEDAARLVDREGAGGDDFTQAPATTGGALFL